MHLERQIFWLLPILILSSLLLVACGGDTTTTPTLNGQTTTPVGGRATPIIGANGQITVIAPTPTGDNLPGLFVWVNQNDIWLGGTKSQTPPLTPTSLGGKALTKVEPLAQAISPALSPDNTQVAYGYSPEPQGTPGNIVIGQDIWVLDLKTNTAKMVIKREEPQTFLDEPAWSEDSKYLYFSYRTPLRDQKNIVIGEKIGIDRFELATSTRQPLIEDARYPAPTPDGKSMVYIATDASGGTYDTALKLLDIATKQSKSLLDKNSGFLSYFAPRPSPDGKLIVFSGVGGPDLIPPDPNAPLPSPTLTGAGRDGLGATLLKSLEPGMVSSHPLSLYRNVATHGVPFDLWLVKLDGSGLSRLTSLFEDQPIPVWSKDGKQVAFMAGFGLYIIDLDSKKLIKKSDKGVHGGFDWRE